MTLFSPIYRQTLTAVCSAECETCYVSIGIQFASAMTDLLNQKALHNIFECQWWVIIQWWISNAQYSNQVSVVLNSWSWMIWCGNWGELGLSKGLEIVCKVGRQGKWMWAWRGNLDPSASSWPLFNWEIVSSNHLSTGNSRLNAYGHPKGNSKHAPQSFRTWLSVLLFSYTAMT
jgi:hypothetical protein